MFTKKEHIRILAKNVVSRLEQDEAILLNVRARQHVYQDLFLKLEPMILTDEEIRERVLVQIGQESAAFDDSGVTESDQFKSAKAMLMKKLGENAVQGLYYQHPVRTVAIRIAEFMMNHHQVEDVFPSDEELEKTIVEFLKRFNPGQLH